MYIKFTIGFFEKREDKAPLWRSSVALVTEDNHPESIVMAVIDGCRCLIRHQVSKAIDLALNRPEDFKNHKQGGGHHFISDISESSEYPEIKTDNDNTK